jgi:hypothetical protein
VTYKNVIFKLSFLDGAVWEGHFSVAMLDTSFPFSLIEGAVGPEHFAVTISLVVNIVTFVDISRFPHEYTKPIFAILCVFTIILIAWSDILLFFPFTFAMF